MKHKYLIAVVVLVLAVGLTWWMLNRRGKRQSVYLETARPQYGYISKTVTATGTIEPVDTVTVGSQVSGTIKKIFVDFNSVVQKGQLIAQLDKSLLLAQVNQYQANLEVARAQLIYQNDFFNRQDLLYKTGAISKQDFETASYQYNAAKATVASVQAQLDAAQKNLSYCDIYSPIDGVVLTRNISIGQTVAASFNTPTLFIIAKDITKMQVQAAVDEADIGTVALGQHVSFTVDAFPDDVFTGTVGQIRLEPQVSANVVTYTTIVQAPNDSLKLKPGMTANIFIYTSEEPHALLISGKALKFKPAGDLSKQFKMQAGPPRKSPFPPDTLQAQKPRSAGPQDNKAASTNRGGMPLQRATVWTRSGDSLINKEIYTGITDDNFVQVLSGLSEKDEVVLAQTSSAAKTGTASAPARSPFMPTARRPAGR